MSHKQPAFHRGAVGPRPRPKHAQSHPGVSPLHPVTHRRTGFQPLPPPLGQPPYQYDLSEKFPDIGDAIKAAKCVAFHVVGDSGGVKDAEFQVSVAEHMVEAVDKHGAKHTPLFCYHVGDVVYFTGAEDDYYSQFYEPYSQYHAPIFAIPGNHDGEVDDPTQQTSLDGWVAYFMQEHPDVDPISMDAPRVQLDLPNPYWTLVTPYATIIGMYTNVPEHGSIDSVQQQWITNEFATAPDDRALILALHHPIYSFDTHHSGSSRMADVLENAIRDTGRVPNLVLSGHVHDYQRIEQTIGVSDNQEAPTPFIVIGNGGYHNLHKVKVAPGDADPETGAVLQYKVDDKWGFLTLTIDEDKISGFMTEVGRDGTATATDKFEYSTKPVHLATARSVKML